MVGPDQGPLDLRRQAALQDLRQGAEGFAHSADVLRLELLQQFGGIYLDLDIVQGSPIDSLLEPLRELILLAHEGIDGRIGAANALMLARRNASILAEWYARYRDFSDRIWNGFSVRLPMELAVEFLQGAAPSTTPLYWPPWNPWGVAQIYRSRRCLMPHSFAVHLWETEDVGALSSPWSLLARRKTCSRRSGTPSTMESYDFSAAVLEEGTAADETDMILMEAPLLEQIKALRGSVAPVQRPRGRPHCPSSCWPNSEWLS